MFKQRLGRIQSAELHSYFSGNLVGIEKESLRVAKDGFLSQTDHPAALGSALTHPWITTDYGESMLELITPPMKTSRAALDFLRHLESYVYQNLDEELLWTASMPCIIGGADSIRIGEYGHSNIGRMKHVYREALAWRYGKVMQMISGVHFNHSIAPDFMAALHELEEPDCSLIAFNNDAYMALTRNLLRYGWLVIYLFGASPAICKSFLDGKPEPETMEDYQGSTLYEPFGTSLRMGNIGYTNAKSAELGINVGYNSLREYISGLRAAITQPAPEYEKIGVQVDGVYRQLNTNALQIENEYYSTVRPKQITKKLERPTDALADRGIAYLELRSVDVNPFHPAGLSEEQLHFFEVLMHFCLLYDSPEVTTELKAQIDANQYLVAHQGRKPGLMLQRGDRLVSLKDWGGEIIDRMRSVAALMDQAGDCSIYTDAVESQAQVIGDPTLTPSAKVLDAIFSSDAGTYFHFAQAQSEAHRLYYASTSIPSDLNQQLDQKRQESFQEQTEIERSDDVSFEHFLADYFSQPSKEYRD